MRWLVYSLDTGEELRRTDAPQPDLAEGEAAAEIPASAEGGDPLTEWQPASRTFMDVPRLDADGIYGLFTAEERAAILTCGVPQVIGLVLALRFMRRPIRASDPLHVQGVALLQGLGLITAERAAQILAFQPPVDAD
ncbi:hypothetical protein [Thermaurantiacus tibetensis]|uniref:hypothetical protein n=1 Tax=Thermaurantiacus tibetensis TaxID=2759035 RepID=UPI00188F7311|nr:hypothetical protein [Thermaurantiacus tibetensis]